MRVYGTFQQIAYLKVSGSVSSLLSECVYVCYVCVCVHVCVCLIECTSHLEVLGLSVTHPYGKFLKMFYVGKTSRQIIVRVRVYRLLHSLSQCLHYLDWI